MIFSRLKNRYGFNSQLFKNFFKFIVFTLLVCVVVNVFVYQNMRSVTNERIAHENYYETKRIADSTESIFRELDFILNYILGNRYIQTYIVSPKPDQLIYDINSKIHEEISMFSVIYDYIDSIYIYSRAYDRVFTSEGDKPMDELSDINWVRVYSGLENGEFKAWLRKKDDVYPYVYTYMRKTSYNGQDGAVILNINLEKIKSLQPGTGEAMHIYIVGQDNTILFSNRQEDIFSSAETIPAVGRLMKDDSYDYTLEKTETGTAAVAGVRSQYDGITYVTISEFENYQQEIISIWSFIFWVVLSVMLIGVAMAIMFAISTYKPIESIITALERPESWMDGGKDNGEITYIASKIVSMIQTNEKLGQEFANQLQIANQTYAYALQVQINPHFLFNTLNIINMMIVDDYGPGQRSSKTLVALSKLLRFGLGNEDKFVSVGEEVAYTKIYVNILKMRYIDLFDVTYDVDASVADKRILKLCLQPLVENAINHGLIEKEHDGHITISIQNQNGLLSVEVADNGVGMSEEALQKLRERIYEDAVIDGKQIGIKNVRQRIKLLYGEQYDIEIYSREGEGTRICFKVPML